MMRLGWTDSRRLSVRTWQEVSTEVVNRYGKIVYISFDCRSCAVQYDVVYRAGTPFPSSQILAKRTLELMLMSLTE